MSDGLSIFHSEGQSSGTVDVPLKRVHATPPPTVSNYLSLVGWLNLLAGILVGGWLTFAGVPNHSWSDPGPTRIALGAGLLVQGVIGCAFFLGFASIVENLTVIRRRLES